MIYIITEPHQPRKGGFMSDKLLFKKRTVTKKDMEEMVCINCSSSPIDNPGILHLRYIGKTVILPERDYTIPNSPSSRQKNLQGEKEKIPREGVLIFSIARCPATVWHEGNVPIKISAGKVLFTPPGSRERLRLQNETKEKTVRYYFGVERNINCFSTVLHRGSSPPSMRKKLSSLQRNSIP